jgi:hypothetical protein
MPFHLKVRVLGKRIADGMSRTRIPPQMPRAPSIRFFLANGWETTKLNRSVHRELNLTRSDMR